MSRLILSLRGRKPDDYRVAVALGIDALRACGISHVHDITNSWLSVEPLLHSGLQGCVYLEVMGQKRERALARMKEAMRRIVELRRSHADAPMRVGLSLHSPGPAILICCGRGRRGAGKTRCRCASCG